MTVKCQGRPQSEANALEDAQRKQRSHDVITTTYMHYLSFYSSYYDLMLHVKWVCVCVALVSLLLAHCWILFPSCCFFMGRTEKPGSCTAALIG